MRFKYVSISTCTSNRFNIFQTLNFILVGDIRCVPYKLITSFDLLLSLNTSVISPIFLLCKVVFFYLWPFAYFGVFVHAHILDFRLLVILRDRSPTISFHFTSSARTLLRLRSHSITIWIRVSVPRSNEYKLNINHPIFAKCMRMHPSASSCVNWCMRAFGKWISSPSYHWSSIEPGN